MHKKFGWPMAATIIALAVLVVSHCGGKIPSGPGKKKAPAYVGGPFQARPLPAKDVAPHPCLSPTSCIHSDSYNSDVDDLMGPLGVDPFVKTGFIGMCPITMFDGKGRMASVCLDKEVIGMGITAIDPDTLEVIDRYAIPIDFRKLFTGGEGDQGVSVNGGYFHLDADGRAIVGTQDNRFLVLELRPGKGGAPRWTKMREVDLNPHLPKGQVLIDTVPDWEGHIWFASSGAAIGYLDEQDRVRKMDLPGEFIENGLAVAEDGVFVLTSDAAYRFEIGPDGEPRPTWREGYERSATVKPGTFALGSGSTPTLLGDDLITFTDNADSRVNLLVMRRGNEVEGSRTICKVPLFEEGKSAVDVSMIGYGRSIIVENIYNAGGFLSDYRGLEPGLIRIDVRDDLGGCEEVWEAPIRSTTVPKLSTRNGLIYTYTQDVDIEDPVDAWYFTAVDFETGQVAYRVLAGTGKMFANAFGGVAIGPNGAVYQGVAGGVVYMKDGKNGQ